MSNEKSTVPQEAEQQHGQVALPLKLAVTARLIEPKGNLVGFASLKLNDCFVIDDFKILQNDKGIFVGMPSKPDKTSKTGYRDTSRPITKEFRAELTEAVTAAYHAEFEKLQTRAAAIASPEKQSIPKQLAEGAEQAAQWLQRIWRLCFLPPLSSAAFVTAVFSALRKICRKMLPCGSFWIKSCGRFLTALRIRPLLRKTSTGHSGNITRTIGGYGRQEWKRPYPDRPSRYTALNADTSGQLGPKSVLVKLFCYTLFEE